MLNLLNCHQIKKSEIYNKEDIYMLPRGDKIYKILEKSKIY